ncbi:Rdx family protein [Agaricicola taiwanensis]|uniref:Rdx family protein n=1 Tax=Agaricicola taiwanensis TaxID=591372 RepID=UPI0035312F8C
MNAGDRLIWDRKTDGGFPDIKTLKQPARDELWPDQKLGHIAADAAQCRLHGRN